MKLTRTVTLAAAMAVLGASAKPAVAAPNLYFQGGPMRNMVVDLVFFGNFNSAQLADFRDYVTKFGQYVAGDQSPIGKDPVVRYYGLWSVVPGEWIVDTDAIPASLDDNGVKREINLARNGGFGSAKDFAGNTIPGGIPTGVNRLTVLVTTGINLGAGVGGFHQYNNNQPYAVVRGDNGDGIGRILSHEIMEAMTDVTVGGGWVTNEIPTSHEGADACDFRATDSPTWISSSGDNVTGICDFTLDPSFPGIAADSCQIFEPEQYAPIAAAITGSTMTAFWRAPNGHINGMGWFPGSSHGSLVDFGQPSASVKAAGKPAEVFVSSLGQVVFTRGTDNGLWKLQGGAWTPLGGVLFGDPTAVVLNGNDIHVFVLGTNNHIFRFNAAAGGWSAVPDNGGSGFSGPPRAAPRTGSSIDLFAVGENGHLEWIPFSTATGFSPLVDLGTVFGRPHHTPVGFAAWSTGRQDIFATTEVGVVHRGWNGSWASDYDTRSELGTAPSGSPAVTSSGNGKLDAIVVDRSNKMFHVIYNGSWQSDPANPIVNDAVGDAEVLSSSAGLEVFYRSTIGELKHLTRNTAGTWIREGAVTGTSAVQ